MSFLYPLGFLALIAIPVLVFIYIIKNRYTEQTIASTYLWTLSEKFLRKRIPINRITGLLSLILQILAVVFISIILAHPVLSIKNQAREYCFILDGSGSMNMEQGGSTRFEEAKKRITKIINDSANGSTYRLIFAGSSVFGETYREKSAAIDSLQGDAFKSSFAEVTPAAALSLAQEYFDAHKSVKTYLITDRTYEATENITVINVNSAKENYGISDVEYFYDKQDNLIISGNVISYGEAATVTLEFYFDESDEMYNWMDVEVPSYEEYLAEQERLNEFGGEMKKTFEFNSEMEDFKSFKVRIAQDDALDLDNEAIVYNVTHTNYDRTILVYGQTIPDRANPQSATYIEPFLVESALRAAGLGKDQLDITTDVSYEAMADKTGYGLYIFQNCVPADMPREGVVWFINPTNNVNGGNFKFQGEVHASTAAKYYGGTNTSMNNRLAGVDKKDFELDYYAKLRASGDFQELITCDGNPLLLVGTNAYRNREVVFSFDFRASGQFVLSANCTTIVSNLLKYSFPSVVEETCFISGDTLEINIINGCMALRVNKPSGDVDHLDPTNMAIVDYTLDEVGLYTVVMTMKDNSERSFKVYSAMPISERVLTVQETSFIISGVAENNKLPGKYDNLLIIFIILAVIAVADFGVYCYEQYQLR